MFLSYTVFAELSRAGCLATGSLYDHPGGQYSTRGAAADIRWSEILKG